MNHAGLARELSVLYGRALRLPVPAISESPEGSETAAAAATVEILDADGCSRFVGRVVRG